MKNTISKVLLLALSIITISFIGCSDSSTTPSTSYNYAPMKTGSNYVYKNFRLDSLTGLIDSASMRIDSFVVGSPTTMSGKTAYAFDCYTAGTKTRTDYYTTEGQTVWGYWKFIPPGVGTTALIDAIFPQDRRWEKFADYAWPLDSNWIIADTTINNISLPGVPLPVTVNIKLKGKRVSTSTVTLDGTQYPNTTKFELTLSPTASLAGINIPLTDVKQYVWIAENVGVIKEEFPAVDLLVTIPGMSPVRFKGDGTLKVIKSYLVK